MRRPRKASKMHSVREVLGFTLEVMRDRFWEYIPRSKVVGKTCTVDFVVAKLNSGKVCSTTSVPEMSVDDIITYFGSLTGDADPNIVNAKNYLNIGTVTDASLDYIVMLPHLYREYQKRINTLNTMAVKYINSAWIASPTDVIERPLKIIAIKDVVSMSRILLTDQDGNLFEYFVDKNPVWAKMWLCVNLKFSVFSHAVDENGRKVTFIHDVTMEQVIGDGSDES